MQRRMDEAGKSNLIVFIWLSVLFLAAHVAIKVVPVYMDYSRMQDEMTVKAGVAQVLKDEEILRDLVTKARELDLPLGPDNFAITRDAERRKMKISTSWDVEVHFLWGAYIRTFHFEPAVEESFMSVVR